MDYVQLAAGLLIAGESTALFTFMNMNGSPWLNPMNRAYVIIDVLVGSTLIASGFGLIPVLKIILVTAALIHLYRDYEAMRGMDDRYAFNTPLLIVLNIRLLLLLYVIALA
jgi:fatty acid desaturase